MDFFSHFLIGILTSIFTLKSLNFSIVVYAGVISVLADFDIFLEPLRLIKNSPLLSHKGISHSYPFSFIISFITGLIFSIITGESFLITWFIGFIFYSLHVTLDFLAASRIPIFYPFIKRRFRFFTDRAINPYLALFSGSAILFYFIVFFLWPELYFSSLANYLMGFYIIYILYRIFTKVWMQFRLPKHKHYIPGILPLTYLIYENQNKKSLVSFKLSKKYQFRSKKVTLLESEVSKNSKDMELYEEAISLSKKYLFFSKWNFILPVIQKGEKNINVILILAESYVSSRAYTLRVIFDLSQNQVINEEEGFNYRIK